MTEERLKEIDETLRYARPQACIQEMMQEIRRCWAEIEFWKERATFFEGQTDRLRKERALREFKAEV